MRIVWYILMCLCCFTNLLAQEDDNIDEKYLEDQVYLSLTYNILNHKPAAISQNGLSGGIAVGFIKDIPFNIERNFGLAIGLGYSYNAYIQNLKISKQNQTTLFELAQSYKTNRLRIHSLDLPIEIRWRNSTPEKYKFWRIYGGVQLSYLFSINSKYVDEFEKATTKNIAEFNKIRYGLIMVAGFSTWNVYVYYGLNRFFKNVEFNGNLLELNDFKIGLKFYML